MRVRWTKPAATALAAIQNYIAKQNPRAAFVVIQRIRIAVKQLEEHPNSGRTGRIRGTHELVVYDLPYIVAYRIKKETIQILNVYHTSRKWPEKFR